MVYMCQMMSWQEKFNQQVSKIVELDAQLVKHKEANAKLKASLKDIKERRLAKIIEITL